VIEMKVGKMIELAIKNGAGKAQSDESNVPEDEDEGKEGRLAVVVVGAEGRTWRTDSVMVGWLCSRMLYVGLLWWLLRKAGSFEKANNGLIKVRGHGLSPVSISKSLLLPLGVHKIRTRIGVFCKTLSRSWNVPTKQATGKPVFALSFKLPFLRPLVARCWRS
jgi:hypothetical protein